MFPYMEKHTTVASSALYYDLAHARDLILEKDPFEIARNAQVNFDSESACFSFLSLNQRMTVSYPACKVAFAETGKSPDLHWYMPILHYLAIADGTPLSGEAVSIRDLKEHVAHPELFEYETGATLYQHFDGKDANRLKEVCAALGGKIFESNADLFAVFAFLPRFPIYIKLWMSDDEVPGSGKMLFDRHGLHYLDEMDIHTAGPLFVHFLKQHYAL